MADRRDSASRQRWWSWTNGRIANMDGYTQGTDDDGEPIYIDIPVKMLVCSSCDGRGCYVNPNIDRHGLSREDFDQDPDFADDYRSGMFNIQCEHCLGSNVVPWPTQPEHTKMLQEWLGMLAEWDAETQAEIDFGA